MIFQFLKGVTVSSKGTLGAGGGGSGVVCVKEKHFKLKALPRREEGSCGEPAAASLCPSIRAAKFWPRQLRRSIRRTCRESSFCAKRERFLYFAGRRDAPSSDRFHCRLTSVTRVLTPSVRNPILEQPGGRDRGGGARALGFKLGRTLLKPRVFTRLRAGVPPDFPVLRPRGPERRCSTNSGSFQP